MSQMRKLYLSKNDFKEELAQLDAEWHRRKEECAGDDAKLKLTNDEMMSRFRELAGLRERSKSVGLLSEARELDIGFPMVTDTDSWMGLDGAFGLPFLSPTGSLKVRRAVDEEKVRRREVKAWWWKIVIIPALTALIGLVGAVTGLVAVLHSK
ncbi:MAG TPA: hypothetical protein VN151_08550 [Terracidiphilus sp.]|nr:hypothetical protein [Terracidiphilus sp.]